MERERERTGSAARIVLKMIFWTTVALAIVIYVIATKGSDAITEPIKIFFSELTR